MRQQNWVGTTLTIVSTQVRVGICCSFLVLFLLGSFDHVDVGVTSAVLELYSAVNQSIEGVVLAHANVLTGTMLSTALTADDVTGLGKLTTKIFTPRRLLSLSRPFLELPTPFFMCHNLEL